MRNTEQCAKILKKSNDPDCQTLGSKYDGEVSAYYDVLQMLKCDTYFAKKQAIVKEWKL